MSGSTTVNLTPGQTSFTTHASGVTINGSNITNGVVVNYCITDYGNFATITVGNGDENIAAYGTNNLITIGSTPIEAAQHWGNWGNWCYSGWGSNVGDGDSDITMGANSVLFAQTGRINLTAFGGGNSALLANGNDTICATGDSNFFVTGDGNDIVNAGGTGNQLFLGTSQATDASHWTQVCVGGGGAGGNTMVMSFAGTNSINVGSNATGATSTIITSDGVQDISACGPMNSISIGNTPVSYGYCGGYQAQTSTIYSGSHSQISAGNGNVSITAQSGFNTVTAGAGNDTICLLGGSGAGNDTVLLGNGSNMLFLAGANNQVADGSGYDEIQACGATAVFQINAQGGCVNITGFNTGDHLDLSQILLGLGATNTAAGLAPYVTVTPYREGYGCYSSVTDTLITVHGTNGTANITLENYNGVSLAAMTGNATLTNNPSALSMLSAIHALAHL